MNTLAIYVRLDYHQDSVQVSVLNKQGELLLNRAFRTTHMGYLRERSDRRMGTIKAQSIKQPLTRNGSS